jgi:hypothetical protein
VSDSKQPFISMCETAIQATTDLQAYFQTNSIVNDQVKYLIEELEIVKEQALEGTLEKSTGKNSLGLTRMLGEWQWPNQEESKKVVDLIYQIENFWIKQL